MGSRHSVDSRREMIVRLARETSIVDVAQQLGLSVSDKGGSKPKTSCPFHDDTRPSLVLFQHTESGIPQYHCFACSAHGDIFELIKKQLGQESFQAALDWLAARNNVQLPRPHYRKGEAASRPDSVRGLEAALSALRSSRRREEKTLLEAWAVARRFSPEFLRGADVFGCLPPRFSSGDPDRELANNLEAAGLIRRPDLRHPGRSRTADRPLPFELPYRDFYSTPRILFFIQSEDGQLCGVAGRAVGDEQPKYLYTPGFPRAKTLYRWHAARPTAGRGGRGARNEDVNHVVLVEGLTDALRLEALRIPAAGLLGSSLSQAQLDLLTKAARTCEKNDQLLAVHVMLDADEAGMRGAASAVTKLLDVASREPGLRVDVIVPPPAPLKADPDSLLADIDDPAVATERLATWCYAPLDFLLACALRIHPSKLGETWDTVPTNQRLRAFHDIERRLGASSWEAVLARVPAFETQWGGRESEFAPWQASLERFLTGRRAATDATVELTGTRADDARLLRAIQIAQASTQRREFPVDEGSWERLEAALDLSLLHLRDLLRGSSSTSSSSLGRPRETAMLAVKVPKPGGGYRQKALPDPESLAIQQYVLNELLRDHVLSNRFQQLIPAVRHRASATARIVTTGPSSYLPKNGETVSFAYMIEMEVVNSERAPQGTGMFRPYYDCWRDFIKQIETWAGQFSVETFHVARLDIRGFYDTLPRSAVVDILHAPLQDALEQLADDSAIPEREMLVQCAPLLAPDVTERSDRARYLVDWLCNECFEYEIEDPGTGLRVPGGKVGLPQGPDLSAYLASIALFPLDRSLSELVDSINQSVRRETGQPGVRGALYARYVDDMVLVARSAADLVTLRRRVESQLAQLGLELSPKSETLPPMDESTLRDWLTDRRGIGLGASGLSGEPPFHAPLSVLQPLADAGELDRGDSLGILHDPQLSAPSTPDSEVEDLVSAAMTATDLRQGDRALAARHLWRCVVAASTSTTTCADAIERMANLWARNGLQTVLTFNDCLAWLDGLEQLMRSRLDRSPALGVEESKRVEAQRTEMARLVHHGLCEVVVQTFETHGVPLVKFAHMLRLKGLVCRRLAALISRHESVRYSLQTESAYERRLLLSLVEVTGNSGLLDTAGFREPEQTLSLAFHKVVVQLKLANEADDWPSGKDPLHGLGTVLGSRRRVAVGASSLEKALSYLVDKREADAIGFALEDASSASNFCLHAATTCMWNLAPKRCVTMLEDRPALRDFAIGVGNASVRYLPTPPGSGAPGLVGLTDNDAVARIAWFGESELRISPEGLPLSAGEATGNPGFARYQVALTPFVYQRARGVAESSPQWLARTFRSLVAAIVSSTEHVCIPTAYALLAAADESAWSVVGFRVDREKIIDQAFVRFGEGGLIPVAVLEQHADLWRIGTALADWMGRSDCSISIESQRVSAAVLPTEGEHDWARESLLRFALCRLRGIGLPTTALGLSQGNGGTRLPLTVERVLRRLESFPPNSLSDTPASHDALAHLMATIVEGRALHARLGARLDPSLPGSATALLADLARVQFSVEEQLAGRLPEPDSLPAWAPRRRAALALVTLSERLRILAAADPQQGNDPSLRCLAAGTRILALELNMRAQVLELWSQLDPAERDRLCREAPVLGGLGLDDSTVVVRDAGSETLHVREAIVGTRGVLNTLRLATREAHPVRWELIRAITPTGWFVALATLTGALGGNREDDLAAIWTDQAASVELSELAAHLAMAGGADTEPPWGGLDPVERVWQAERTGRAFALLQTIDDAAGLKVKLHQSSWFRLTTSRRGPAEVAVSDGVRRLPGWTVVSAAAIGEHGGGAEFEWLEGRRVSRWTETWRGATLVGLGVVQPSMSEFAGTHFKAGLAPSGLFQLGKQQGIGGIGPPAPSAESPPVAESAPTVPLDGEPVEDVPDREAPPPVADEQTEDDDPVRHHRRIQERSWDSRSEKPAGHLRVALLQWDVDSSHQHPGFEECQKHEPILFDRKDPSTWTESRRCHSCAESRRQAILKAALRACRHFKVDALLLPEYSVRPETVDWLESELPKRASWSEQAGALSEDCATSIWCGTYLVQPLASGADDARPPWSAVLDVLLSGKGKGETPRRIPRRKVYPAPAVPELFRPADSLELLDLSEARSDLLRHVLELICSEVFLVTCPSNLPPLARARRELRRRFGMRVHAKNLADDVEETIRKDLLRFATLTSISEVSASRRKTVLFVPAMTSRTEDYTVLGQAAYLSALLTTVFCNAVYPEYGHGRSCFVGHDGWLSGGAYSLPPSPSRGPYHGLQPGIFSARQPNWGRLLKEERAMVIADIDPVYAGEGRPRPQAMLPPLRLVAHLPILEPSMTNQTLKGDSCRCQHLIQGWTQAADQTARGLVDILARGDSLKWRTSCDDPDPSRLSEVLCQVAKLLDGTAIAGPETSAKWLELRAKRYVGEHAADPVAWPPPVAVDMLWVDNYESEHAEIEMPPYCAAPPKPADETATGAT